MKKPAILFLLVMIFTGSRADHITGGVMSYTCLGQNGNTVRYAMTMKLYMRCNSGRQFNDPTIISVFRKGSNTRVSDTDVPLSRKEIISLTDPDPCISNPPTVCYEVGYYDFVVSLPVSPQGYVVAGQVNYRIAGISNLSPGYSQIGATYTTEIPGNADGVDNVINNSAVFTGSDLVIVCAHNSFNYSFAASDKDNDNITYSFCDAYRNSSSPVGGSNAATPLTPPPYSPVPYGNGFSSQSPLGPRVSLNTKTGLISGIAPAAGTYVVTVCASESRNGKLIATQRKDLQISITNCSITAAILDPEYQLCGDTKTITFTNQSISSLINSYAWEVKDQSGNQVYTSNAAQPTLSFADTGLYTTRLIVNPGQRCTDTTSALVRVYPGFKPAYDFDGICFSRPTTFTDRTTTVYGQVNSWLWHYDKTGDDTALTKNTVYTYAVQGEHFASLTVTNTKGCIDTITQTVEVFTKPPVRLAFRDTLICPPDQLQLKALGTGNYTWSPAQQMVNDGSATPLVSPLVTTKYYVDFERDGCTGRDSVLVRVTPDVTLKMRSDTTICTGDAVKLTTESNALAYNWTPASDLDTAGIRQPVARPAGNTTYSLVASISKCVATGKTTISTAPYPLVNAGNDTVICFREKLSLSGSTNATSYTWSPVATLNNFSSLTPFASPEGSTSYILTAFNNSGCTKKVSDTVLVTVLPKIVPQVNGDTAVVLGQPIRFNASGGSSYFWEPDMGLSANNIPNPTASYDEGIESLTYKVIISNQAGCSDSAFFSVKVFSNGPAVFVPTGFTPNADGKNDLLRPIPVGMRSVERFVVFNRYGQQVFATSAKDAGWDGRINGQLQPTGVFVWMVQATDYAGRKYISKGTSTLIR